MKFLQRGVNRITLWFRMYLRQLRRAIVYPIRQALRTDEDSMRDALLEALRTDHNALAEAYGEMVQQDLKVATLVRYQTAKIKFYEQHMPRMRELSHDFEREWNANHKPDKQSLDNGILIPEKRRLIIT